MPSLPLRLCLEPSLDIYQRPGETEIPASSLTQEVRAHFQSVLLVIALRYHFVCFSSLWSIHLCLSITMLWGTVEPNQDFEPPRTPSPLPVPPPHHDDGSDRSSDSGLSYIDENEEAAETSPLTAQAPAATASSERSESPLTPENEDDSNPFRIFPLTETQIQGSAADPSSEERARSSPTNWMEQRRAATLTYQSAPGEGTIRAKD